MGIFKKKQNPEPKQPKEEVKQTSDVPPNGWVVAFRYDGHLFSSKEGAQAYKRNKELEAIGHELFPEYGFSSGNHQYRYGLSQGVKVAYPKIKAIMESELEFPNET